MQEEALKIVQQIYLENSFAIYHASHVATYGWHAGIYYVYIQSLCVHICKHDSPEETLQRNCD